MTSVYRVHYTYTDDSWVDVNADSVEEAQAAALEEIFDDDPEIVDAYEL